MGKHQHQGVVQPGIAIDDNGYFIHFKSGWAFVLIGSRALGTHACNG